MIETTIIPTAARVLTEAEQVARLSAQRAALVARLAAAREQKLYLAMRNADEAREWANAERSLRIDLEILDGDLKHFATPRDERYADVRAQMLHEDRTREVVSDGSVNWEAL